MCHTFLELETFFICCLNAIEHLERFTRRSLLNLHDHIQYCLNTCDAFMFCMPPGLIYWCFTVIFFTPLDYPFGCVIKIIFSLLFFFAWHTHKIYHWRYMEFYSVANVTTSTVKVIEAITCAGVYLSLNINDML